MFVEPSLSEFLDAVERERGAGAPGGSVAIPLVARLLSDQLTPVLAYRRLVAADERTAPSFLLESVEGGERQGRHSILGAQPRLEVIARGHEARVVDHASGEERVSEEADPLSMPRRITAGVRLARTAATMRPALANCFIGGWVGYAGYDSVRYAEPGKMGFERAPEDDRGLPDLHMGLYDSVVVFDNVDKAVHLVQMVFVGGLGHGLFGRDGSGGGGAGREELEGGLPGRGGVVGSGDRGLEAPTPGNRGLEAPTPGNGGLEAPTPGSGGLEAPTPAGEVESSGAESLYYEAIRRIEALAERIQRHSKPLPLGVIGPASPVAALPSNITEPEHASMVGRAREYIYAGDIFQVVVGQRFERRSWVDPFDVYRALRVVNPSPYMVYMQGPGCILVASSPEILCRVRREERGLVLTNRPLAGTRRRGASVEEDAALERELLADAKERAEHVMLVDLGRNDVGKVARPGTVRLEKVMEVERYSHVMHISSTVTGVLRDGLDSWDALRATLPVGTISGAPKVRAMQIIDELEPLRRGPYGGGMGYVGLDGQMDVALALRTIVAPTALWEGSAEREGDREWTYHIQAAGGIVADSEARAEYLETVNKAAALARAIDLAEEAFGGQSSRTPTNR